MCSESPYFLHGVTLQISSPKPNLLTRPRLSSWQKKKSPDSRCRTEKREGAWIYSNHLLSAKDLSPEAGGTCRRRWWRLEWSRIPLSPPPSPSPSCSRKAHLFPCAPPPSRPNLRVLDLSEPQSRLLEHAWTLRAATTAHLRFVPEFACHPRRGRYNRHYSASAGHIYQSRPPRFTQRESRSSRTDGRTDIKSNSIGLSDTCAGSTRVTTPRIQRITRQPAGLSYRLPQVGKDYGSLPNESTGRGTVNATPCLTRVSRSKDTSTHSILPLYL